MIDDKLAMECREIIFQVWTGKRLPEGTGADQLNRLDAALAGKDAVPLTSPSVAPADTLARIRE